METRTLLGLLLAFSLAACDGDSIPDPGVGDIRYARVNSEGKVAPVAALDWPCVTDQYSGLTWQVKADTTGLDDWRNTYSWHDPDESHDGELDYRGAADGGQCKGSTCDTLAYVEAVNQRGQCGWDDWRMPSRDELASLSDLRKADNPPTANRVMFPHMQSGEYWSANDYSYQWNSAWVWNFEFGHDRVEWKASARYVRLVRGEAHQLARVKD